MGCEPATPSHLSPLSAAFRRGFRTALLEWFDRNRRPLPWRANRDPYPVWVSEIMLQQTRVAAVLERYPHFLQRFPTVFALARAQPASVLASWSGLGYYRRARLLHAAARLIVRQRGGRFPQDRAAWQELPGVGCYTAAAIASICYEEPCAAVDGNVERVLQRALGANARDAWWRAGELVGRRRPGDFNQAMMELGAMVCTPRSPECAQCPVRRRCQAFSAGLPLARPKLTPRQQVRLACALVLDQGKVLLVPRGNGEKVMPGMWELPPLPSPPVAGEMHEHFTLKHAIMNTEYLVDVVLHQGSPLPLPARDGGQWFKPQRLTKLPLTGLARKALQRVKIL